MAELLRDQDIVLRAALMRGDAPNGYGDVYPWSEVKEAARGLMGLPVFSKRDAEEVKDMKGKVIGVEANEKEKVLYCTVQLSRALDPLYCAFLERWFEENETSQPRLGFRAFVNRSVCTVCNHVSYDWADRCEHVGPRSKEKGKNKAPEKNFGISFASVQVIIPEFLRGKA